MGVTPFLTPVFLFGSIRGGSGKSSILAHLAVYLHSQGKRTAVIDFDTSFQHKLRSSFPRGVILECYGDLVETALEGTSRFRRTFFFTPVDRIAFFPAFKLNDPAKLLIDAALGDFFLQLRTQFDVVLVNLPPGGEAFSNIENFIQRKGRECGNPVGVFITTTDIRSLVSLDSLLRTKPSLLYLSHERLVFLYNRLPRGVEDSTIDLPKLDWSETKRVFDLPISLGFKEMEDFARQVSDPTPMVLKESSQLHRAISTLAHTLFETANGRRQSDSVVTNSEKSFLCANQQILERIGGHIKPLCRRVASCLYTPGISAVGFIEANQSHYRIIVRLSKIGRYIFPPILEAAYEEPVVETNARLGKNFQNKFGPVETHSNFRMRESIPQIQVRALYRFDDCFAAKYRFNLHVIDYYIYSDILAEPQTEAWKCGLPNDIPSLIYMLGYLKRSPRFCETLEKPIEYNIHLSTLPAPSTFIVRWETHKLAVLFHSFGQIAYERSFTLNLYNFSRGKEKFSTKNVFPQTLCITMPTFGCIQFLHWNILAQEEDGKSTLCLSTVASHSVSFENSPLVRAQSFDLLEYISNIPTIEHPEPRFIKSLALNNTDSQADFKNVIFDFKPADTWYFTKVELSKTPVGLEYLRPYSILFRLPKIDEILQIAHLPFQETDFIKKIDLTFSNFPNLIYGNSILSYATEISYKTSIGKYYSDLRFECPTLLPSREFVPPAKFVMTSLLMEQSLPKIGWDMLLYNLETVEKGGVQHLTSLFVHSVLRISNEYRKPQTTRELFIAKIQKTKAFSLKIPPLSQSLRLIPLQRISSRQEDMRAIFPATSKNEKIKKYIEVYNVNLENLFTISTPGQEALVRLLKIPLSAFRKRISIVWRAAWFFSMPVMSAEVSYDIVKTLPWSFFNFERHVFQLFDHSLKKHLKEVIINYHSNVGITSNIIDEISEYSSFAEEKKVSKDKYPHFPLYGYQPTEVWFQEAGKSCRFLNVWPFMLKLYETEARNYIEVTSTWVFKQVSDDNFNVFKYPSGMFSSPYDTLYAQINMDIALEHVRINIPLKVTLSVFENLTCTYENFWEQKLNESDKIDSTVRSVKQRFSIRHRVYFPTMLYNRSKLEFQKLSGIDVLFRHLSMLCKSHLLCVMEHGKPTKHNVELENKAHFTSKLASFKLGAVDFMSIVREDIPQKMRKKIERKEALFFSRVRELREAVHITQTSLARIVPEKNS